MDDFFNIEDTTIIIPGVKIHNFIQISDTHICAADDLSSKEESEYAAKQEAAWASVKEDFANRFGEKFGEARKISTVQAFQKLITYAISQNPEALLISGDIIDYMHPAGERFLRSELKRYGGKTVCVPGNHESCKLEGVWNEFSEAYFDDIKIIALDNSRKTVTADTLLALESSLSEAVPAVVMMHIPIATDNNRTEMKKFSDYFVIDEQTCDENARLLIRLLKKSKNVKALLCGHVHGYHESSFFDDKKQYCCSAGMIGNLRSITVKSE